MSLPQCQPELERIQIKINAFIPNRLFVELLLEKLKIELTKSNHRNMLRIYFHLQCPCENFHVHIRPS